MSGNGAADKPQAFPPEVGFIRWLCGASRQATIADARPPPRCRVRDNAKLRRAVPRFAIGSNKPQNSMRGTASP
jgi:hypothetical protein